MIDLNKLVAIAENEQKIYEAGKTDGYNEGYDIGIIEGIAEGRTAEHEEFWENALKDDNWQDRFSGTCWNNKTFRPTKDIKVGAYANYCFAQNGITDMVALLEECGITLDTSGITVRGDGMFNYNQNITTVPYIDLSNAEGGFGLNQMFTQCTKLHTIVGLRVRDDGTDKWSSAFSGCSALVNITIYGVIGQSVSVSAAKKLSKDSIISFMTHLSDTATEMKITFSTQAIKSAFNIPVDADIESNTEWMAIRNTKLNWQVAYA